MNIKITVGFNETRTYRTDNLDGLLRSLATGRYGTDTTVQRGNRPGRYVVTTPDGSVVARFRVQGA